jgi:P27 family predicted phage terminase small subunit
VNGLPPCPGWLGRKARKHWAELGSQLAAAGLISVLDGDVFAAHCDTVARFAEVCEKLRDVEQALEETPNGFQVQSAFFTVRSKLFDHLIKGAREFGLTPAARSAIKAPEQAQLALDGWADV